jgi:hypothetical protein
MSLDELHNYQIIIKEEIGGKKKDYQYYYCKFQELLEHNTFNNLVKDKLQYLITIYFLDFFKKNHFHKNDLLNNNSIPFILNILYIIEKIFDKIEREYTNKINVMMYYNIIINIFDKLILYKDYNEIIFYSIIYFYITIFENVLYKNIGNTNYYKDFITQISIYIIGSIDYFEDKLKTNINNFNLLLDKNKYPIITNLINEYNLNELSSIHELYLYIELNNILSKKKYLKRIFDKYFKNN